VEVIPFCRSCVYLSGKTGLLPPLTITKNPARCGIFC
jgi:hypothetical protein